MTCLFNFRPVYARTAPFSCYHPTDRGMPFLAEEKNTQELAHYLRMLFENPNLRNRMGLAAREKVEEQFDLKVQNRKLENLYDEVSASYTQ